MKPEQLRGMTLEQLYQAIAGVGPMTPEATVEMLLEAVRMQEEQLHAINTLLTHRMMERHNERKVTDG